MKRKLSWCLLTEKRLIKKLSYLVVLLMVPFLVWGLQRHATDEAGMVSIGLVTEAKAGSLSDKVIARFMSEKGILRYVRFETEEEALNALSGARVDALWIFPEHLEEDLMKLAQKRRIKPVVRVLEREDNVALVFTREILCSRIYPELMYDAYVDYVQEHMEERASKEEAVLLSKEHLQETYESILWKGSLFQAKTPEAGREEVNENYFLAPLRGLLALWLVLAGFAALLYHKIDERNGVYDATPVKKRLFFSFGLQGVVLMNCGIIYLVACGILGVLQDLGRELLCLALLLIGIAGFCNLIGEVVKRVETIGIMIPFLILVMLVACPIFIDLRNLGAARCVLPPYLYLKAIYSDAYLPFMIGYDVCVLLLCLILNIFSGKRAE